MAVLSSRLILSLQDLVSGPAKNIVGSLKAIKKEATTQPLRMISQQAREVHRETRNAAYGSGFLLYGMIRQSREFNEAIWGTQAALLANTEAHETNAEAVRRSKEQAEELAKTAMDLSKQYGLLPEKFAKASEEAAKMGASFEKTKSLMRISGLIFMSDRDSDPGVMTRALGSYDLIYGAPKDEKEYERHAYNRASVLAYAGAKTRTSASKIEEGMRNYMGIHGAFGGRFEDAVALIAMGSQLGQMEKETGTSLKSLTARFLNMPASGRGMLANAGIDIKRFMDFSAVDPMRATNQLIGAFPQQLQEGTRGRLLKFLEKAYREGRMADPGIINETLQFLERNGLSLAGVEDREAATSRIAAIMHGAGGTFDPLGFFREIKRAVDEGRASPGILASIGDPRRIHQYAGLLTVVEQIAELRDDLLADQGRYLQLIEMGFPESDAGRILALEAAWQRLSITLTKSEGIKTIVETLTELVEVLNSMPTWAIEGLTYGIAGLLTLGALGGAVAGMYGGGKALKALLGLGAAGAGAGSAAAGASRSATAQARYFRTLMRHGVVGAPLLLAGSGKGVGKGLRMWRMLKRGAKFGAYMTPGISQGLMAWQLWRSGKGLLGAIRAGGWRAGMLVPGFGTALTMAALGMSMWEGWEKYKETGSAAEGLKEGLGWNALKGLYDLFFGDAQAAEAPKPGAPQGGPAAPALDASRQAVDEITLTFRQLDLTAEGRRIIESLATGMREGIPAVTNAARAAADAAARAAVREAFSDGGLR